MRAASRDLPPPAARLPARLSRTSSRICRPTAPVTLSHAQDSPERAGTAGEDSDGHKATAQPEIQTSPLLCALPEGGPCPLRRWIPPQSARQRGRNSDPGPSLDTGLPRPSQQPLHTQTPSEPERTLAPRACSLTGGRPAHTASDPQSPTRRLRRQPPPVLAPSRRLWEIAPHLRRTWSDAETSGPDEVPSLGARVPALQLPPRLRALPRTGWAVRTGTPSPVTLRIIFGSSRKARPHLTSAHHLQPPATRRHAKSCHPVRSLSLVCPLTLGPPTGWCGLISPPRSVPSPAPGQEAAATLPRGLRRTESPSCKLTLGLRPHDHQWVLTRHRSLSTGPFTGSREVGQKRGKVSQRHGLQMLSSAEAWGLQADLSLVLRSLEHTHSDPSQQPRRFPTRLPEQSRLCQLRCWWSPFTVHGVRDPPRAVLPPSLGRATAVGCASSAATPQGPRRQFPRLLPRPGQAPGTPGPCCKPPAERGAFLPPS